MVQCLIKDSNNFTIFNSNLAQLFLKQRNPEGNYSHVLVKMGSVHSAPAGTLGKSWWDTTGQFRSCAKTHPVLSSELAVVTTGMTEPVVKAQGLPDAEVRRQATVTLYIGHPVP
jgi:hypothetical protein